MRLHPLALLPFLLSIAASNYITGYPIEIQCLNRTIDGEHVLDSHTQRLQYLPFYTCNETSSPLTLNFGVNAALPCTIPSISDELYHHLEYYVHHDTPLSCRMPTRPPALEGAVAEEVDDEKVEYTPLTIAIAGKLELSHLHVQTEMNMLVHTEEGEVGSAVAYSRRGEGRRVIIGDPLPLVFRVRWLEGEEVGVVGGVVMENGWGLGGVMFVGAIGVLVGVGGMLLGRGEVGRRVMRRFRGERNSGLIGLDATRGSGRGYGGYGLPVTGNGNGAGGYGYPGGVKRKD